MRYYLIAGEASGDLHGSNLIKAIREKDTAAEIRCWGGDLMQSAGSFLVKHYRDLSFMGFAEVISHLPEILKNLKNCKKDIRVFKPDVLVLIDYPGFNLRIARWAKDSGIKVGYYISPQVWAWKENRVKKIKASVDKMLVILPFEKEFYEKRHFTVTYVGHPLTEVIRQELQKPIEKLSDKPIVALLPGSRQQEIRMKLPVMLSVTNHFPNYHFVVAQAPAMNPSVYHTFLNKFPDVELMEGQTYNLLKQSEAALVTSGTATLETALFGVPEVVCYKGNPVSYQLAKKLIKVKYISLVNLILDKPAVKELIQNDFTTENVYQELKKLLTDSQKQDALKQDYKRLWELLANENSSEKAALAIIELASR